MQINFLTASAHKFNGAKGTGILYKRSDMKLLPFYNMKQASNGIEMIDEVFHEVFPRYGFKVREEQVSLSKHMYESMKNGKISINDIAVGLGKTHA